MRDSRRLITCALALLAACRGAERSGGRAADPGGAAAATVTFAGGAFTPERVEIAAGEAVRFENASESPVWPASHIHPTHAIYPDFDAKGPILGGDAWAFAFDRAGYWRFHNHLDPSQTGLVVVRGDGSEEPPPPLRMNPDDANFRAMPAVSDSVARALLTSDSLLHHFIETYGPAQTVAVLARAGARARIDCHQRAHMLGHMAYRRFGAVALATAGHECHSGSYHGATEAMFQERGTLNLEDDVASLCGETTNRFFLHQCMHGIGHGLMAWTSYELHDALALCDRAGETMDQHSCYSGVFMENAVGGLQGSMGHKTAYLSDDPHFPCNVVDERYMAPCYFYQTSHMVSIFRGDFSKVAAACAELEGFARRLCFESMGRDVGGRTRGDPDRSIALCSSAADPQDRRHCLDGAVQDYFWDASGAEPATEFCRLLDDDADKRSCYGTIIQRAGEILSDPAERARFCSALEEPYARRCRRG